MAEKTPAEKAKDIIDKFWKMGDLYPQTTYGHAVQCGLIMVEEIITIWKGHDGPPGSTYSNPGKFYWMQVEIELKKLRNG